jgi:chromatin segregation and condensation protein Rec8/ScpA/Scc1 (kleisin family)
MSNRTALVKEDPIGPLGIFAPPEIAIECEAFQGSLGMLFQCVRSRKIDLLGIPLAPICEAYFAYLMDSANHDLEQAAVALTALAYLIERKAWMLLPVPEDDEPEADDLFDAPEPYAHEFLPAIQELLSRHEEHNLTFFRSTDGDAQFEMPFDMGDVTVGDLARALERLLAKAKPDSIRPIGRPRRSLTEQMVVVLKALSEEFRPLDEVVEGEFTRSEVVWWFLALLELIRLGQARVKLADSEVLFARGVPG